MIEEIKEEVKKIIELKIGKEFLLIIINFYELLIRKEKSVDGYIWILKNDKINLI